MSRASRHCRSGSGSDQQAEARHQPRVARVRLTLGRRAYIAAGSVAAAAYELGTSESTARQHLSGLYRRTGYLNAAQAAFWLGMAELAGPILHLAHKGH